MPVGVGAALVCALACSVAGIRHRGRARLAWSLFAAAALWWAAAEPLVGLGMAGAAPLAAGGLALVPTGGRRHPGADDVVDAAIAASALLVVAWIGVFQPVIAWSHGSAMLRPLAEVAADVLLGSAVLMLMARATGAARLTLVPLSAGFVLAAAGDAAMLRPGAGGYPPAGPFLTVIAIGFLVAAVAAVVASLRPVAGSARQIPASRLQAAAPYVLSLGAVVAFVAQAVSGRAVQPFVVGAVPVVFALLVARQQLTALDHDRLLLALGARERELSHRADHDPLTDLPNRSYFVGRLERALSWRRRGLRDGLCTVMLIDLDDFKRVNALVGHREGDRVLTILADRLRDSLRSVDTIARFGGDEFSVLFDEVPSAADLVDLGQRVVDTLHAPIDCGGEQVVTEASVGIALCGPNDSPPEAGELLRRADIALRMAKENGRGAFGVFEASLRVAMEEPRRRHSGLQHALGLRQFLLHYQPIIDVGRRRIVGVEALLRWRHPEAGLLSPDQFLVDLEDVGLSRSVGRWVLEEAVAQTASLRNQLGLDLFVTVNVSSTQLADASFVDSVARALSNSGLPSNALIVELTESGNVAEDVFAIERLTRLRGLGVRLAIDDFGTGYSSMSYLHRFPVDVLKIDKSFVDDLVDGNPGHALAEELVRFGGSLGLLTIAEGVESEDQHLALSEMECPLAQGFFYAGPLSKEQLTMLLRSQDVAFPLERRQTA